MTLQEMIKEMTDSKVTMSTIDKTINMFCGVGDGYRMGNWDTVTFPYIDENSLSYRVNNIGQVWVDFVLVKENAPMMENLSRMVGYT